MDGVIWPFSNDQLNLESETKNHEQIAELDPKRDYEEISFLLQAYEFPWDYKRALEFALFRTYAVPSISGLLAKTGEFLTRPRKRYDDTELILYEIARTWLRQRTGTGRIGPIERDARPILNFQQ